MSEQDNRAIVQRGYEAFGRGNIASLLELLVDDIVWESFGPPEFALAGARRGRQQVAEYFQRIDTMFEIQRFQPQAIVAQGDRVVALGRKTARAKATGNIIETAWAHAFTVRGGRIVAFQEHMDTAAVVTALRSAHAGT